MILAAVLIAASAPLAAPSPAPCARPWKTRDASALRAVVLLEGESDPAVASAIAALGAKAVASLNPPDAAAGANLAAAGLAYVARLSVREIDRLPTDAAAIARLRSIALAGIEYFDDAVTEGYATGATQARAYGILKGLFPDRLVLYATRLDPVATDAAYLDDYFRPEFSDLVAPYFYPVGTTILGPQREGDDWEGRLRSLLAPVAARTPSGKGVFPVIQAFAQTGYPVHADLAGRQLAVYAEFWPDNANVAAFSWTGLAELPDLLRAFAGLFGGVPAAPRGPCALAPRPVR